MLPEKEAKRLSKWLSYILRHHPESAGIVLDEHGWTDTQTLITNLSAKEPLFNPETLQFIVANNSKKRFAFNEDGSKIRASQGHSVDVELGYTQQQPPELLFHGTTEKNIPSILKSGLKKMERHHVHLSADKETAQVVGARFGKPVVLTVKAGLMHEQGFSFFISENGVWLTDRVPAEFLSEL